MSNQPKQVIALGVDEFQVEGFIISFMTGDPKFWVHAPVHILLTDEPNQYIDERQPWQIRILGDPEPYGELEINADRYGVLISYIAINEENWSVINEFMDKFFGLIIEAGGELYIHDGDPYEIAKDHINIKFRNANKLLIDQTISDECKKLIPKTHSVFEKWKTVYEIIQTMNDEYRKEYDEGFADNPSPSYKDIRDRLIVKINRSYSDRTLKKILSAGKLGCLD